MFYNKVVLDLLVQSDIFDEFDKINEISDILNQLKIIINYASAGAMNSTETILAFVNKIYPNQTTNKSEHVIKSKRIESCELKHLKHIWILLNVKRAVLLTRNDQV